MSKRSPAVQISLEPCWKANGLQDEGRDECTGSGQRDTTTGAEVPVCPVPAEVKLIIYFLAYSTAQAGNVRLYSWMYFFSPLNLSFAVSSTSSGLQTAKRR